MQDFRLPRRPLYLTLCAIICLLLSSPASTQVCGDANCDGEIDIADYSSIIDFFAISHTVPPCYNNIEFDGHANVNISDYLELKYWYEITVPVEPYGMCSPLAGPLTPTSDPNSLVAIEPNFVPAATLEMMPVTLVVKFDRNLKGFAVPFRILIGDNEAEIVAGSFVNHPLPSLPFLQIRQSGNNVLACGADRTGAPAARYEILEFWIYVPFAIDAIPLTLELLPFPIGVNPHSGEPVNNPLFIFGDSPTTREYVYPTVVDLIPCCQGRTGNVDCDNANTVDIADLSALIDYLYITFVPMCCPASGNCDGSPFNIVDISDLSALIDYLYISFTPTSSCL